MVDARPRLRTSALLLSLRRMNRLSVIIREAERRSPSRRDLDDSMIARRSHRFRGRWACAAAAHRRAGLDNAGWPQVCASGRCGSCRRHRSGVHDGTALTPVGLRRTIAATASPDADRERRARSAWSPPRRGAGAGGARGRGLSRRCQSASALALSLPRSAHGRGEGFELCRRFASARLKHIRPPDAPPIRACGHVLVRRRLRSQTTRPELESCSPRRWSAGNRRRGDRRQRGADEASGASRSIPKRAPEGRRAARFGPGLFDAGFHPRAAAR